MLFGRMGKSVHALLAHWHTHSHGHTPDKSGSEVKDDCENKRMDASNHKLATIGR